MKKLTFKENLIQNLIKVAFFLLSVLLIAQSFPREGRFRYSFQEGKPWRYGLMTAPYDFQIFKTDSIIDAEKEQALSEFQPFLLLDTAVIQTAQQKLRTNYTSYLRVSVPVEYLRYVSEQLRWIYHAGIVSPDLLQQLMKDSVKEVRLVHQNEVVVRPIESLFTSRKAYEAVFQNLPPSIEESVLRNLKLTDYLMENLALDEAATDRGKAQVISQLSQTSGMLQRGERIIDRGEIITADTYQILSSLKRTAEARSEASGSNGVLIGQYVLVFGLFLLQFLFLWFFRPFTYQRKANVVFILINITGLVLLTSFVVKQGSINVYIIPYAILPIMVRTFFDSRTALFAHIITVLISSTIVSYPYEFLLLQITAGMASVYSLKDLTQRSQLVFCALLVFVTYAVMYFGITLIQEGYMHRVDPYKFLYFFLNAALLLFSYLLIYVFEWMFGYTSNVTLVELSNINNPLLRQFSESCPGSFQHSLQVSNLVTAAAQEINANVQLARTGAMYHDIGKISNPIYFVENQSGYNPHDALSPEESAAIITSHVTDGLKLAHKHKLPLAIRDFIRSHHGVGVVRFFLNQYMQKHPGEEIPEAFYYKGDNPATKETAILMMADAVEASSRTLKNYSEQSISDLVERIIDAQIKEGFYKNVPITFRDLERLKNVFKQKLLSFYHGRIEYPDLKDVPPQVTEYLHQDLSESGTDAQS